MFPCESKVGRHILVGENALNELCPAKLLLVKRVLLRLHVESGINYSAQYVCKKQLLGYDVSRTILACSEK
jgi:hypothetical protein